MSATSQVATTLTPQDLKNLMDSFITPDIAEAAGIVRVNSLDGAAMVGRLNKKGVPSIDCAGLSFEYRLPEEITARQHRLRRDNPELEQLPDGTTKERDKYLSAPGARNFLYFTPSTQKDWLKEDSIRIVISEGEKKALALQRYFDECGKQVLVIGLSGVWNWRGTTGKTINGNGSRVSIKGVIPDINLINWKKREVEIIFDADSQTNPSVEKARKGLARELQRRGAIVRILEMRSIARPSARALMICLAQRARIL